MVKTRIKTLLKRCQKKNSRKILTYAWQICKLKRIGKRVTK